MLVANALVAKHPAQQPLHPSGQSEDHRVMNLHELISELILNTKGPGDLLSDGIWNSSLGMFLPELIVCATILVLLLVRIAKLSRFVDPFWVTGIGAALALLAAAMPMFAAEASIGRSEIFGGMLVFDGFTVFSRSVLLLFAFLFAIFSKLSGIPDRDNGNDIYALVLGATLGMCLMASANHLLIVFMGVEMASVPSYVLAGMLKGRRKASEAALKYAVYGAGAAGVMLYGISLLAGVLNTVHLPTMAWRLAEKLDVGLAGGESIGLMLGGLMMMVGLAYKLSAVPFHFWAPDVFEGAAAEVGAFLSISSKAAALALLVRVVLGIGMIAPESQPVGHVETAAVHEAGHGDEETDESIDEDGGDQAAAKSPAVHLVSHLDDSGSPSDEADSDLPASPSDEPDADSVSADKTDESASEGHDESGHETHVAVSGISAAVANQRLGVVRDFIGKLIALLAIVTCTFGNLAAYGQTNIKRLMAYSTIAHAGYMLMAIPALLSMAGSDNPGAASAVAALCIYLGIYLFMNLGAFAMIAFLRNSTGSEEIADYGGLIRRNPVIAVSFSLILFSLVGLPPLAGFIGKFAIFASLVRGWQAVQESGQSGTWLMVVLVAGGLNTAISLFYYLRVVKVMTMDPESDRAGSGSPLAPVSLSGIYVLFTTSMMIVLFLAWDWLAHFADQAASSLF